MHLSDFANRADELIAKADQLLPTFSTSLYGVNCDSALFAEFRAAGLSFLANVFGTAHSHYREFDSRTSETYSTNVKYGRGILAAAKDEIVGGWTITARGIVSAEIFSDFLEMAEHLLDTGYKDAAAVMIGSTLEEHLRQLGTEAGLSLTVTSKKGTMYKKADTLNAELAKAAVYGKLDQKNVTAWLGLRNSAAHGSYSDFDSPQVVLMHQGVSQFLARFPI